MPPKWNPAVDTHHSQKAVVSDFNAASPMKVLWFPQIPSLLLVRDEANITFLSYWIVVLTVVSPQIDKALHWRWHCHTLNWIVRISEWLELLCLMPRISAKGEGEVYRLHWKCKPRKESFHVPCVRCWMMLVCTLLEPVYVGLYLQDTGWLRDF